MENCEKHCLPITNLCCQENCQNSTLCDICINIHNKEHKYIISYESIKNNSFEKIIERNYTRSKITVQNIIDKSKYYIDKIEYDFYLFSEMILNVLNKTKANLIEKIENLKELELEEVNIWKKLKFDYGKSYLEYLQKDNNFEILNRSNFSLNLSYESIDNEIDTSRRNTEIVKEDQFLHNQFAFSEKKTPKGKKNPMKKIMRIIHKVIEKHMYLNNESKEGVINDEEDGVYERDFNSKIKDSLNDELNHLKADVKLLLEDKINNIIFNKDNENLITPNMSNRNKDSNSPRNNKLMSNTVNMIVLNNKANLVKRSPIATTLKETRTPNNLRLDTTSCSPGFLKLASKTGLQFNPESFS